MNLAVFPKIIIVSSLLTYKGLGFSIGLLAEEAVFGVTETDLVACVLVIKANLRCFMAKQKSVACLRFWKRSLGQQSLPNK